jgi:hypothetical protein
VETQEQPTFLASEACEEMQGSLVDRPEAIEYYLHVKGEGGARRYGWLVIWCYRRIDGRDLQSDTRRHLQATRTRASAASMEPAARLVSAAAPDIPQLW